MASENTTTAIQNLNPLNFPNAPLRIPALALYSVRLMTVTWSVVSSLSN
jgi:hypothetical protein